MLQLHLGAFTVRLAPCAAQELMATLHDALVQRSTAAEPAELAFSGRAAGPRGQA